MRPTHLQCTECRARHDAGVPTRLCGACGSPLEAHYDLHLVAERVTRDELARRPATLWRYHELLPLPDPRDAVTLGEGGTPLLHLPRLGERLGLPRLYAKDEAQNPTGSFKARGMSVAVSMARHLGSRALAAPSAGNAGGALAAYGARAGLPVVLAMPRDVPLANRIEAEVCGARVELVEGTIADCGRWIAERAAREGWFDLSTLKEPYRVEGKKTMGFELAQELGWELPDVILYPAGGGTGLVGLWKAFGELRDLGWLAPGVQPPRLVAVQAAGCAPIVDAFRSGAERATPPTQPATCASGLRVPAPIGDRWMLRTIRASGGTAVAVDDPTLLHATAELARAEGLFTAPEGGALVAAARHLLTEGFLDPSQRIVLLLTGAGTKYLECFPLGQHA